jgi:hypothetical protein
MGDVTHFLATDFSFSAPMNQLRLAIAESVVEKSC